MLSSSSSTTEVAVDVGHKFLHVLTAVVACHVVVKVLPNSLDPIVIRAIGWEKVELHLSLPGSQRQLDLAAVMDFEVVEDDVNPTSVSVADGYQPMNEEKEQRAVLAFSFDPSELAGAGIQRPGQITLLVQQKTGARAVTLPGYSDGGVPERPPPCRPRISSESLTAPIFSESAVTT